MKIWSVQQAAMELGISESTLYRKISKATNGTRIWPRREIQRLRVQMKKYTKQDKKIVSDIQRKINELTQPLLISI